MRDERNDLSAGDEQDGTVDQLQVVKKTGGREEDGEQRRDETTTGARRTVLYISSALWRPPLRVVVSGILDMGATVMIIDGRSGFHPKPQQRISKIRRNGR